MSAEFLKFKWSDRSRLSVNAVKIVRALRRAGFAAFFAGGAVRDALLRRPFSEIDIATAAKPEKVEKLFAHTIPTGKKHGTVTVRLTGQNFEVTTFRAEGPYEKRRRPIRVKFLESAEEDAKRRDFTINALFYDPEKEQVLDYVKGIADLSHRAIRLVGDAEERIDEDALRMMRAVRFAATLNFSISASARKAIKERAKLITEISAERVKQELDRVMLSPRASVGVGLLDIVGLLSYILPEVKNLQGVSQPREYHAEGDVYAHTLLALEKMDESFSLPARYGLFFHDLGKAHTREIRDGKITFYKHPAVGAELAAKICRRLKFSKAEEQEIVWLIRNHLVPNDLPEMRLATRRKWALNSYFADLLRLYRADAEASLFAGRKKHPELKAYRLGLEILRDLEKTPTLKEPILTGFSVMKILKIKPGPAVGKVLKFLEEKKLAGELENAPAAQKFLQKNKKLLDKFLSIS